MISYQVTGVDESLLQQSHQKIALQVTQYDDGTENFDLYTGVDNKHNKRGLFVKTNKPTNLVKIKKCDKDGGNMILPMTFKGQLIFSSSKTLDTIQTINTPSPTAVNDATSKKFKGRTLMAANTPIHLNKRKAESYPPLCSHDLLLRCRSINHLAKHMKLSVEGSKSSAVVSRAATHLAEEIKNVLSANAALFSSLWDSHERIGDDVIKELYRKREKDVHLLLATYNALLKNK
jgi:hypothetical protein